MHYEDEHFAENSPREAGRRLKSPGFPRDLLVAQHLARYARVLQHFSKFAILSILA